MTDLRTAAQQALEALENTSPLNFNVESDKKFYVAITALRAALAQQAEPVREPVATLTAQRDALLEALKRVLDRFDPYAVPGYETNVAAEEKARAAIKAAEGEKT